MHLAPVASRLALPSKAGRRGLRLLVSLAVATSALLLAGGAVAASACATTTTTTYSVQICITGPTDGATVTGDTATTGTATILSGSTGVQRMVFNLDGAYLITDYQSPYTFTLPSVRWVDGGHTLSVSALMRDGTTTSSASESLTFSNGTTTAWAGNTTPFTPTSGTAATTLVAAAVGDGAGGETTMTNVVNTIKSWNPNVLLYLGDVYEKGAPTEYYNWYNQGYGQLRSITDPVIGNHEYSNSSGGAGYFTYWGPNSDTYSFNAGGWHFIALNANSQLTTQQWNNQLTWLNNDLAAHAGQCIVAMWHQPLFNIGPEGATTRTQDFWTPLANAHATLVLNGHDHDYQRWTAMDANGNPSTTGVTELIAGGGGHSAQTITGTDSRVLASVSGTAAYGAMKLTFSASSVSEQFINQSGTVVDSSTIGCKGSAAPPGAISGTVTDASTGAALSGATVSTTGASTTTDANGNYTLSGLTPASYSVTAGATGYTSQSQTAAVTSNATTSISFALTPKPGSISGTVKNTSGGGIQGATVSAGGLSTTTNRKGNYTLSGLAPGTYQVTASAAGFGSQTLGATVTPGGAASLSFTLSSPGSIAGKVTDSSTGLPISGATVATSGASATTDANGNYALSNLAAGTYSVTASATGHSSQTQSATVTAGSTSPLDFALAASPGAISGNVTDAASGNPISGATVATTGASTTTDANGNYTLLNVAPGSYSVTASASGYASQSATVSVTAGSTSNQSFSLTIVPGAISGTVTDAASGNPISGATVATTGASATTDANGNYTLSGLTAGTYSVTASAGGYSSQTQSATVTAGATAPLSFSLTAPGSISGHVTDASTGNPISGATVSTTGASTTTDSGGNYALSGLAPGSYQVSASAAGYGAQTQTVAVTAGTTASQSFALSAQPGTISGKVTDAGTGIAIAGAAVSTTGSSTTTDSGGNYSISVAAAGSYSVTASATAYSSQTQTVTVSAGGTASQSFALTALPGAVTGTVTDTSTGNPIAGATVSTTGASSTTDATGNYTLSGLVPGSYQVTASASGYTSSTKTATVTAGATTSALFALSVPSPSVFSDGFESGTMGAWSTNAGVAVESGIVHSGAFAAEASTSTGGVYARATLSAAQSNLYYRAFVYVRTVPASGQTANLIGLRTSTGGSIARVYVTASGTLGLRNDVAATTTSSSTAISAGAWHSLEMHVIVNGTSSTTQVWLDGSSIAAFNNSAANLGTSAAGQVQIGENQTGRSYDFIFDDVSAATSFI